MPLLIYCRMQTSWPMKSLLEGGAVVALGSDWFVTDPSPLEGIYAAVTRQTIDGRHVEGLVPQEKVSVEDALRGYTIGPAYAAFEENIRGSVEVCTEMILFIVFMQHVSIICDSNN